MIAAVDSSSFIAFTQNHPGADIEYIQQALKKHVLFFPSVVIAELFSAQRLNSLDATRLANAPTLSLLQGYWQRAGIMRAQIRHEGKKANLADCLIAQNCIDHNAPLITRDQDFRHFEPFGLQMLL